MDNIRWATVFLVALYHVAYMFNGVGIFGGIPGAKNLPWADVLAAIVYPWFMVLLFAIAGISARYSLDGRTPGAFIKERAVKLLVPSTLGLFVVHWITGYLEMKLNGALAYIPPMLRYPIAAVSGIGPLWFAQMLFLFSCFLVGIRFLDREDRLWRLCGGANAALILALFVLLYASSRVGNVPVLTMYRFGIYFVSFLIGYLVFSHEEVMARVERMRHAALLLAVASGIAYTFVYGGTDYTQDSCLQSPLTNFYLWVVVLSVFGFGRKYWNWDTPFTRYMSKSSFGVYVLHYPLLLLVCYGLCTYFDLSVEVQYLIALVLPIPLTFATYELLRRVPLVRFLVLGIRK